MKYCRDSLDEVRLCSKDILFLHNMSITKLNRDLPAVFFIILAMCVSMELYFTWKLPQSIINSVCAVVLLPYLLRTKIPRQSIWVIILLIVNFAYNYTHNTPLFSFLSFLNILSVIIISIFVISSSIDFKIKLLNAFDLFIKCICLISLVGWLLYLAGIPLPHYYSDTSDFYSHEVYYLFIVGANNVLAELLPRFCGMFLEPGHIGSTCCLLLFVNKFDFKNKSNYIYLLSIIFSLSLAAYCLFFIGLCLHFFFKGVHIMKYILFMGMFAGAFYVFGQIYNGGDNILNEKILSRLVIVDGELSGDNRTSMLFDAYYEDWFKHGDLINGYGKKAYAEGNGSTNILHGCASFKRFFFINGVIGVVLVFVLYVTLFSKHYSKQGLGFFILLVICNMIRDYPFRLMWFYLFILGIVVLSLPKRKGDIIY